MQQEHLDATCPDLPAKTYDDFIVGPKHIDTPFVTHHDSDSASLTFTVKSLAKSSLQARTIFTATTGAPELRPVTETQVIDHIRHNLSSPVPGSWTINRLEFALAFDPLATSDCAPLQPTSYLDPSVFDRNMKLLVLDLAPFVRTIISYEADLQKQRLKLSSLISEGGGGAAKGSKRMRTTRAALSALEGGSRSTIRGEKWFKAAINPILVARTAGTGWGASVVGGSDTTASPPTVTSPPATVSEPSPSQSSCAVSPREQPKVKAPVKRGRGRPRKVMIQEEESGDELDGA